MPSEAVTPLNDEMAEDMVAEAPHLSKNDTSLAVSDGAEVVSFLSEETCVVRCFFFDVAPTGAGRL